jgi:general secretion pathway protein J
MTEDIASAEYARFDAGQGAPLFRGEPESVAFVRRAIGPGAGPRLEVVRIGAFETAAGVEVTRAHAAFAPGLVGEMRDAVALLRPPFRVVFAYAGQDGAWRARWQGEAKLPRAVRLQVQGQGGVPVVSTTFALKVTAAPEIAARSESQAPAGASAKSE